MKKLFISLLLFLGISAGLQAAESVSREDVSKTISVRVLGVQDHISGEPYRTFPISYKPTMTVLGVKQALNEKLDVADKPAYRPDQVRLVYKEVELKDAATLGEKNINPGDTVQMVRRLVDVSSSRPVSRGPAGPRGPRLKPRQKRLQVKQAAAGVTLAALTTAVLGYTGKRLYQNKKKRLVRKYKLGNLTKLQDKIWLAAALASYGVPQYLRRLVRNNPGSLESFTGKDSRALAELYYGHAPSQKELDTFIQKFFAGIE